LQKLKLSFLIAMELWYFIPESMEKLQMACLLMFYEGYFTQVDSMPMWLENWKITCAHFNIAITDHDFHRHAGRPIEEMLRNLCKEQEIEVFIPQFF
jgi:hypothetical protein